MPIQPQPPTVPTPYLAYQICEPITIDGRLDESVWQRAPRSPRFVDLISGAPALYDSRAAVLWDQTALYVAFWCEEPYVQATLTERDSLIFFDNDVEVFIDGGDTYYEFEINAFNTVYEVFFIWQDAYTRGSRFDVPEFDLLSRKALSFGGNHDRSGKHFWWGSHPRKARWAFLDWDFPGLQTAVHVDGTINDLAQPQRGWTVELAFPWAGMGWLANGRSIPPQEGDEWRIFFGRYEQLPVGAKQETVGWAWDPIGSGDNHVPERFTPIRFTTELLK